MQARRLGLGDVMEITPTVFGDDRGFLSETYNFRDFTTIGVTDAFVQNNHAYCAARGVLRGLHYQIVPRAQAKLVRVLRGSIFDVAVDIRRRSPTFGQAVHAVVSRAAWNQLYVPIGFAHGFVTLEDDTEVLYKVSAFYAAEHERAIRYDDPELAIDWPLAASALTLSPRDRDAPWLADAELFE